MQANAGWQYPFYFIRFGCQKLIIGGACDISDLEEGEIMLDSMIQMQLQAQAMLYAANNTEKTENAEKAEKAETMEKGADQKSSAEDFYDRMERIHRQHQKRQRDMDEAYRLARQQIRRKRQEEYLKALYARKLLRRALDKQAMEQKMAVQEVNEKRGAALILARSAAGRLPVSAEVQYAKSRRAEPISVKRTARVI